MPIALPTPNVGPAMNMSGFSANLEQGSQIYIMVGGQAIGYISQLTENENYGTEGFYGLGTIMPLELQPLKWTGSLTINGARVYNASWQSAFLYPGSYILQQGLVNIVVYNLITGKPDKVYLGCAPSTYGTTYAANAYTLQNGTWYYLNVQVPGFGI
ncbi:MAG: hypothetical protein K6T83_15465 [Alicyclobacillus sp.]|nr:hypothetical protein [Alicyclobacillus sp.]